MVGYQFYSSFSSINIWIHQNMRAFLILVFTALCAADVSELFQEGYNYQHPAGHRPDFGLESFQEPSVANLPLSTNAHAMTHVGFDSYHAAPTVSKRFFTINAQDHDEDDDDDEAYSHEGGHKNYDVVFAKAPTPSLKSALRAFSNYAGQQQTAVYILSKKLGAAEIGSALRASRLRPHKPQVHFIKYKTPEEAEHAQNQIRSQYDALGGSSEYLNQGSAPVRSFIGSLGHSHRGPSFGNYYAGSRPSSQYLPPGRYLPPRY